MWCDILNNTKHGTPHRLDRSHLMNISVDYDDEVEQKATHPTLLGIKQDDDIEVPPQNWNIPKADPSPVCRSVLESGLEEARWDSTRVPRRKDS